MGKISYGIISYGIIMEAQDLVNILQLLIANSGNVDVTCSDTDIDRPLNIIKVTQPYYDNENIVIYF